jgi:hypothetical protein
VQCTSNDDCSGAKHLCDDATNVCVECLTNQDCPSAAASLCIAGTCSPCAANADCSHIAGKTVCDTRHVGTGEADAGASSDAGAGGESGTCVQCTGTDYATCGQSGGKNLICDSLADTCSTTQTQHSAGLCQTCISDAQCAAGELCAEQTFNGKSVGHFCFYKQGDTANGAPVDCTLTGRPFVSVLNTTSIDGQLADLCTLAVTTCPALNEYRSLPVCNPTGTPNDTLCGFAPGEDSKCEPYGLTQYRCTVTCLGDDDCPLGATVTCSKGNNPNFCSQ